MTGEPGGGVNVYLLLIKEHPFRWIFELDGSGMPSVRRRGRRAQAETSVSSENFPFENAAVVDVLIRLERIAVVQVDDALLDLESVGGGDEDVIVGVGVLDVLPESAATFARVGEDGRSVARKHRFLGLVGITLIELIAVGHSEVSFRLPVAPIGVAVVVRHPAVAFFEDRVAVVIPADNIFATCAEPLPEFVVGEFVDIDLVNVACVVFVVFVDEQLLVNVGDALHVKNSLR